MFAKCSLNLETDQWELLLSYRLLPWNSHHPRLQSDLILLRHLCSETDHASLQESVSRQLICRVNCCTNRQRRFELPLSGEACESQAQPEHCLKLNCGVPGSASVPVGQHRQMLHLLVIVSHVIDKLEVRQGVHSYCCSRIVLMASSNDRSNT